MLPPLQMLQHKACKGQLIRVCARRGPGANHSHHGGCGGVALRGHRQGCGQVNLGPCVAHGGGVDFLSEQVTTGGLALIQAQRSFHKECIGGLMVHHGLANGHLRGGNVHVVEHGVCGIGQRLHVFGIKRINAPGIGAPVF